jgi:hypothetical protein
LFTLKRLDSFRNAHPEESPAVLPKRRQSFRQKPVLSRKLLLYGVGIGEKAMPFVYRQAIQTQVLEETADPTIFLTFKLISCKFFTGGD